jgi:hypothetical protein
VSTFIEKLPPRVEGHLYSVKFFIKFFIFCFACLLGLLSVTSVNSGLHSSFFHGEEGCPYSSCGQACGSSNSEQNEGDSDEQIPCPAVLFGQFYLGQDYSVELPFYGVLVPHVPPVVSFRKWGSRKYKPFGARDPPSYA